MRARRAGEQIAEIAGVGGRRWRDDHDVAGLQLFDRDMDHPIVAGRNRYRDGGGGEAGAGVDRPHVRGEQPDAPLRFMHGRDAAFGEAGDHVGRGALDVLDDDVH